MATYTTEDIERGLLALALNAGRPTAAARDLEAQGHPIAFQRLHDWKHKHAQRYAEIQHEVKDKISERVAADAEAFLLRSAQTEHALLDKLDQALEADKIKPSEIATTMRNLATSRALANDKIIGPLRGRPQVVEHRHNADELLRKLQSLKVRAIDSTATEIQDVELSAERDGANARVLPAATTVEQG